MGVCVFIQQMFRIITDITQVNRQPAQVEACSAVCLCFAAFEH